MDNVGIVVESLDKTISFFQEIGLKLEGERRALFAKRYCEERRKVEQQLRKELDEKRPANV